MYLFTFGKNHVIYNKLHSYYFLQMKSTKHSFAVFKHLLLVIIM